MTSGDRSGTGADFPFIFKDTPEEGKAPQRLAFEFEGLAQTLAQLALNRDNQTPFTVVVRGSWGRGKTTLLRRAQAILDAEGMNTAGAREVKTLWFNAWKYPQEDNLLAGLLGAMLATLRGGGWGGQLKSLLERHKEWLARTVLLVPLKAIGISDFPADRYQGVYEKQAFYDHFEELFRELSWLWFQKPTEALRDNFGKTLAAHQAIAIFLDDLDRCRPSRVVEVLEAINLFLDQPGVCFFLGLDWERLIEILKSEKGDQSEPFLEKIVQVAFDLPPVTEEGAKTFLEHLIRTTSIGNMVGEDHLATMAQVLESRDPRHIKRFLNDLSIRIGVLLNTGHLGDDVKQVPQTAVISWHLLLEAVSREKRRSVTANLGNLDDFLRACIEARKGGEKGGAPLGREGATEDQLLALGQHAEEVSRLPGSKRNLLLHLGSPPKPEALPKPPSAGPTAEAKSPLGTDWGKLDGPCWVKIPGGSFQMGSCKEESEKPPHSVTLSEFWISKYPVTNAQYQEFVQATSRRPLRHWEGGKIPEGKEKHPVVNVSWHDAQAFCSWLTKQTQHTVGLPTEAQWEFAARGTSGREFPWGDQNLSPELANYGNNVGDTTPVNSYPKGATPEGVYDLAGNVLEWCADWFGPYSSENPPDPSGPENGQTKVLRGGGFYGSPWDHRAAFRYSRRSEHFADFIGFRCVVSDAGGQV